MKTNFEHYAKNILEYIDESYCDDFKCNEEDCPVYNICRSFVSHAESLTDEFIEWCKEEYKEPIQMTLFEKSILKCAIAHGYEWISRDEKNNLLSIHKRKPKKTYLAWDSLDDENILELFNDKFQFIQWEDKEPYDIQWLLDNCEVKDNE